MFYIKQKKVSGSRAALTEGKNMVKLLDSKVVDCKIFFSQWERNEQAALMKTFSNRNYFLNNILLLVLALFFPAQARYSSCGRCT